MEWSWSYFFAKLTSRKFLMSLVTATACLYLGLGGDASVAEQIVGVGGAVITVAFYLAFNVFGKSATADPLISADVLTAAVKTIVNSDLIKGLVSKLETKLRAWRVDNASLPDEKVGGTDD